MPGSILVAPIAAREARSAHLAVLADQSLKDHIILNISSLFGHCELPWVFYPGLITLGKIPQYIFKESALGRFFHRVVMSVHISIYISPFHVIFFEASHWPSGHMIRSRPLIGRPPLRVIRQALACNQTGSSIGHAYLITRVEP